MALCPSPAPQPSVRLVVSVAEAAELLAVCTKTIRNMIASGALPSRRAGRRLLIPLVALHRYLDGHVGGGA